jgi:hypothetical protein
MSYVLCNISHGTPVAIPLWTPAATKRITDGEHVPANPAGSLHKPRLPCNNRVADIPPVSTCGDPLRPPRSSPWRGGLRRSQVIRSIGVRPPQSNRYGVRVALGRPKNARQQQSRPGDGQQAAGQPDAELDSYLAALNPEEGTETTGSGRRFGHAEVYQLRLPLMANERLKEIAARNGTSPAALVSEWVLQHLEQLDQADQPHPAWPQQERGPQQQGGAPAPGPADAEITLPQNRYR